MIKVEIDIIIPMDNIFKNELSCCQIVLLLRGLIIRFNVFRHNKNVLAKRTQCLETIRLEVMGVPRFC